jgi:hypothetical protein
MAERLLGYWTVRLLGAKKTKEIGNRQWGKAENAEMLKCKIGNN